MKLKSAYPANDTLGEGPVWSVAEGALYWVDIKEHRLQRLHPESGNYQRWSLPSEIGSFALRERGGAVVALRNGFHLLDLEASALTFLHNPEPEKEENRFNDGKCDPAGRFWAGTMGDGDAPTGALYRLDRSGACRTVRTGVKISNGLGWSPDGATMYYTDSPLGVIFAFDFSVENGTLSNERVFATVQDGFPDGLAVDSEGFVWSAIWDGWRVNRFAPDGSLERSLSLPVQRPTSCTFGGADLTELFITSAKDGLSDAELSEQPEAGHVFRVQTQVAGLPAFKFGG